MKLPDSCFRLSKDTVIYLPCKLYVCARYIIDVCGIADSANDNSY